MQIRCKPTEVEETIKAANEFGLPVTMVQMKRAVWEATFDGVARDRRTGQALGSERPAEFSGVPIDFTDEAGPYAILSAGEVPKAPSTKTKAKK